MPYLTVYTNVEPKNGEELAEKASQFIANVLCKPVHYVVVNIVYNTAMAFGGNRRNQGALVDLQSIGLGDKNKVVAELTAFLAKELSIAETHYINIRLTDCPAEYTASAGRTFG